MYYILPQQTSIDKFVVAIVETIQVFDCRIQLRLELMPCHLGHLQGDITVHHLHKVLHVMSANNQKHLPMSISVKTGHTME